MKASPWFILAALVALVFTLATGMGRAVATWTPKSEPQGFMAVLFGDSRQLLANQFFTEADVYFHSGYYPSVFDKNAENQKDIVRASHGSKESEEEEKKENFMGPPKDWIDAFGRNFELVHHTHLEEGHEREILPWLRMAADLNPHMVEVYTVGAYFLYDHLHRKDAAAQFLREGLRQNPGNCDILFYLGRIYYLADHDADRARNVWQFGVMQYHKWPEAARKKDELIYEQLAGNLAKLEAAQGNYPKAIEWMESVKLVSPAPQEVQIQIDEIKKEAAQAKLAAPAADAAK